MNDSVTFPRPKERAVPIGLTTALGIERALVIFVTRLFEYARLDNETIDDLDSPPEGLQRIQLLDGKIPPHVYAGEIPFTITGEIDPAAIPNYPSIVISAEAVDFGLPKSQLTIRMLAGTFDRDKSRGGRIDCINIMEGICEALIQFNPIGQIASLANDSPRFVRWRRLPPVVPSYHFAELTALFELPTPTNYQFQPLYR